MKVAKKDIHRPPENLNNIKLRLYIFHCSDDGGGGACRPPCNPKTCCCFCGHSCKKGETERVGNPLKYAPSTIAVCPGSRKVHRPCYNRANTKLREYDAGKLAELQAQQATGGRVTRAAEAQMKPLQTQNRGPRSTPLALLLEQGSRCVGGLASFMTNLSPRTRKAPDHEGDWSP